MVSGHGLTFCHVHHVIFFYRGKGITWHASKIAQRFTLQTLQPFRHTSEDAQSQTAKFAANLAYFWAYLEIRVALSPRSRLRFGCVLAALILRSDCAIAANELRLSCVFVARSVAFTIA